MALAALAESVGLALIEYARAVREGSTGGIPEGKRPAPAPRPLGQATPAAKPTTPRRSPREQTVLGMSEPDDDNGICSGELAKANGWLQSNANTLLVRMAGKGLVEALDTYPQRWRRA